MSRERAPDWWPRWRRLKDRLATVVISGGGGVVMITILMLFVFLVYETAPLLQPATLANRGAVDWHSGSGQQTVLLSTGEYGAVVFSIDEAGRASFRRVSDVEPVKSVDLAARSPLTATAASPGSQWGSPMDL